MTQKIDTLLAQALIEKKIVSRELMEEIMGGGIPPGQNLISILVKRGLADEIALLGILSEKFGFPYINLKKVDIEKSVIEKVPFKIASHYKFMPLKIKDRILTIAVAYPLDVRTQDEIKTQLGYEVEVFISPLNSILETLEHYYAPLKEPEAIPKTKEDEKSIRLQSHLDRVQFKKFSITTKFILWFLFISVLPLIIATYISYNRSQKILKEEVARSLFAIADNKANQIETYLRKKKQYIIDLSHSPEILDIIEKFDRALEKGVTSSPEYNSVSEEFRPFFEYQQRVFGYVHIFLLSPDGRILYSTNRKEGSNVLYKNLELTEAFVKTTESSKPEISNFGYCPEDKRVANFISAPVFREADLAGIIMAQMDIQGIYEFIHDYTGLGNTGEVVIASKMKDKAVIIAPLRFDPQAAFNKKITIGSDKELHIQNAVQGKEGAGPFKDYREKDIWAVWRYLPSFGLGMVVKMDTKEIFASADELRDNLLKIGSALLAVVILIAILIARSVTSPIKQLTNVSSIITSGNLSARAEVVTNDEIGELAYSFNQMTESLIEAKNSVERERANLEEHKLLLEKANKELDSFVYTASHDLRAPLRGISSFASFLEEDYRDKLDKEGRDYLNEIRKGTNRMNQLIEDLLKLSRISRIKNPYEDVEINALVNSIIERIKFDIQEHKVDLRVQEDMPVVYCDRIKMGEVFLNLINNAVKFSFKNNKENPRVEVGYAEEDGFYKFYVKDNGIGIDPKYHEQIFGLFKRLHTAEEYDGTGAGLNIVKRIIDDHNGRLWVESELGKGATFYFTIPKLGEKRYAR